MGLFDTLKFSCRRVSMLIEKRRERKLNLVERIGLRYHLGICNCCTTYEKHSLMIDRWLEQRRDKSEEPNSTDLQHKIFQRIDIPR